MQNLNYNGNLKEDIENSKKPFNSRKEIKNRIVSFIVGIPFYFLAFLIFNRFDIEFLKSQLLFMSCTCLAYESIVQSYIYKREKKKINNRYKESNQRLDRLIVDMGLVLEKPIIVNKEDLQRSVIEENEEKIIEESDYSKKSTETITDTFYFLDVNEKIQVLKYISNIVKEKRKVLIDESRLYFAPEVLDSINLPVMKTKKLELK